MKPVLYVNPNAPQDLKNTFAETFADVERVSPEHIEQIVGGFMDDGPPVFFQAGRRRTRALVFGATTEVIVDENARSLHVCAPDEIVPRELRAYLRWDYRHDEMAVKIMAEFNLTLPRDRELIRQLAFVGVAQRRDDD